MFYAFGDINFLWYVIKCSFFGKSKTSDADNIIKNGRMKSLSVTLVCEGCLLNRIGYNAAVNVEGCEDREFIVAQVKYVLENGIENCLSLFPCLYVRKCSVLVIHFLF